MTRRAIYVRRYSAVALARYMRKLCRHLPDMAKDKETTEAEQMLGELRLAIESLAAELVIILGERMPDFDRLLIPPKIVDTSAGPGRYYKNNYTHSQPLHLELNSVSGLVSNRSLRPIRTFHSNPKEKVYPVHFGSRHPSRPITAWQLTVTGHADTEFK